MANILLSILFSILSLNALSINYRISIFSKTLLNIPLSIFEVSVPIDKYNPDSKLYFDKNKLERYVTNYFDDCINDLCGNYILAFSYFSTDDNLFCKTSMCDGVKVHLIADIMPGIKYSNVMAYYIKEANNE